MIATAETATFVRPIKNNESIMYVKKPEKNLIGALAHRSFCSSNRGSIYISFIDKEA